MLRLEEALARRLKELRVKVDADPDTVALWRVPVNETFFSKGHTNLLIKRPQTGAPFVVMVDADLEYKGPDPTLAKAFAAGHIRSGWRAIFVRQDSDMDRVIRQALKALGFDGSEPEMPEAQADEPQSGGLLQSLAVDLTERAHEPTVGRKEEIAAVVSALIAWQPRIPLVVGESGVGKTNLLVGAARTLRESAAKCRMLSVDLAAAFSGTLFPGERDNVLSALSREAADQSDVILALEHFELLATATQSGTALAARCLDSNIRLAGALLPEHLPELTRGPLARRLRLVRVCESEPAETADILSAVSEAISRHHGIDIDSACINACVRAAADLNGRYPAKAIDLLDAAAAMARLSGVQVLGPDDLFLAAKRLGPKLL